jgi:hypothetical protein
MSGAGFILFADLARKSEIVISGKAHSFGGVIETYKKNQKVSTAQDLESGDLLEI